MLDLAGETRRKSLCPLVLAVMVAVFFAPVLFTGRIMLLGDLCFLFYPGYVYLREHLLQGILPLWNPYTGCGEPFLADIERGVYYLPNLLYLLLPTNLAVALCAAFHVLLAGVGAYGLSRAWRVSRTGSLLAGVLYAFNGYTITKIAFPSQLGSSAWFPVILAAYVLWLQRRTRRSLLWVSVALCLQFLSGYPEVVFFTVACLGQYAVLVGVHDAWTQRRWASLFAPILGLGTAGLLAMLFAMAQLYPTWEALQVSVKSGVVEPQLDLASLHPLGLVSLLVPSIYGVDGFLGVHYWAPSSLHYSIVALYLGIAPIAVFVTVVIRRTFGEARESPPPDLLDGATRLRVPFLMTILVFFLLYAMGKYTPFFGFWWHLIPLLQAFVWPPKCLLCVALSLSCLAGIGLDDLAPRPTPCETSMPRWRTIILDWGTLLLFAAVGLFIGACLLNDGRLGQAILRRCFNLDAVAPRFAHCIPWRLLLQDCLKLPIVGLITAFLVRWYASVGRTRMIAAWLIISVAFGDLLITNSYLLQPGPASLLGGASPYIDKIQPKDKVVRFFAIRGLNRAEILEVLDRFPKGRVVERLGSAEDRPCDTDALQVLVRSGRDVLYNSWPMADRAFDVCSINNFVANDLPRVWGLAMNANLSDRVKRRVLSMLNCDRIILPPDPTSIFASDTLDPIRLAILDEPMPRAYVVGGVSVVENKDAVLRGLASHEFDPWETAMIDRGAVPDDSLADLRSGRVTHRLVRLDYRPNSLEIEIDSGAAGLLVVSDSYFPGWVATMNGKKVPIYRVNLGFRGVRVPAGKSVVNMTYAPVSVPVGIAVSLVTVVAVVLVAAPRPRAGTRPSGRNPAS